MRAVLRPFAIALGACGACAALASWSSVAVAAIVGEGMSKRATAAPTKTAPVIDGRLDDAAWAVVPATGGFTQAFPERDAPPTFPTEFRVLYDDKFLYVGIHLADAEPAKIVRRIAPRDREVVADRVTVIIDSEHGHNSGYGFQLVAGGQQSDFAVFQDSQRAVEWDAVWSGATSIDGGGWNAELAIPLRVLRRGGDASAGFGLQIERVVARLPELSMWVNIPLGEPGLMSRAGHVVGLDQLRSRREFEFRPYVVARAEGQGTGASILGSGDDGRVFGSADAGADFRLGLTSGLTLVTTVNPDFGNVEVDSAAINVSRFETFFPEKRPFFTSDADLFETPLQTIYTRRIGAPVVGFGEGQPVIADDGRTLVLGRAPRLRRIWFGAKLTGYVNEKMSFGSMAALTGSESVPVPGAADSFDLAPRQLYAAARTRHALGAEGNSYVGLTGTAVQRLDGKVYLADHDHDAYAQSVDGAFQSTSGVWRLSGQAVATELRGSAAYQDAEGRRCSPPAEGCNELRRLDGTTVDEDAVGFGARGQVERRTPSWVTALTLETFTPQYDPNAAGFATSFNRHSQRLAVIYQKQNPEGRLNSQLHGFSLSHSVDYEGLPLERTVGWVSNLQTRSQLSAQVAAAIDLPGYVNPYDSGGDGARVEKTGGGNGTLTLVSDPRATFTWTGELQGNRDFREGAYGWMLSGGVGYQSDRVELSLQGIYGSSRHMHVTNCVAGSATPSPRHGAGGCDPTLIERTYFLADQTTSFTGVHLSGTLTLTTRLSLHWFGEIYLGEESLGNSRLVSTTGLEPELRYEDMRSFPTMPESFSFLSLKVQPMVRWELAPGTFLYAVYNREQATLSGEQIEVHAHLAGLASGATNDAIMLKLVLYDGS